MMTMFPREYLILTDQKILDEVRTHMAGLIGDEKRCPHTQIGVLRATIGFLVSARDHYRRECERLQAALTEAAAVEDVGPEETDADDHPTVSGNWER